jgi:hypothetical protein
MNRSSNAVLETGVPRQTDPSGQPGWREGEPIDTLETRRCSCCCRRREAIEGDNFLLRDFPLLFYFFRVSPKYSSRQMGISVVCCRNHQLFPLSKPLSFFERPLSLGKRSWTTQVVLAIAPTLRWGNEVRDYRLNQNRLKHVRVFPSLKRYRLFLSDCLCGSCAFAVFAS